MEKLKMTIDRMEGDLVVLILEDGQNITIEKSWLPAGAQEGGVYEVSFSKASEDGVKIEQERENLAKEILNEILNEETNEQ